jgi:hypothetical protein
MVRSNEEYLSNDLTYVWQSEIAQRAQTTAKNGIGLLSAANANLDGTGTLVTVIRAGTGAGTLIKTITLKGLVTTGRGMIRLYIEDGSANKDIIAEIETPARNQVGTQETFALSLEVDYMLKPGNSLKASTELAQNMTITAECLELAFP